MVSLLLQANKGNDDAPKKQKGPKPQKAEAKPVAKEVHIIYSCVMSIAECTCREERKSTTL